MYTPGHVKMYVNDRMRILIELIIELISFVLSFQGDISRFSDRSRELWCEQNTSNVKYKENSLSLKGFIKENKMAFIFFS